MATEVDRIIQAVVSAPVLLIASDFDGALAPIVNDPAVAIAIPRAVDALQQIGRLPHTHAAVVSGRGLVDLRSRLSGLTAATLSGSHGAEMDGEVSSEVSWLHRLELEHVTESLAAIVQKFPGSRLELKARGVAFHYREVSDADVMPAVETVLKLKGEYTSMSTRLGSMVIEFAVDRVSKGDAIRYLRHRTGATSVVFIGDDLTDESAFAELGSIDAGVKVGPGDTVARFRIGTVCDVDELLNKFLHERTKWLAERSLVPIQDHAVLSDQRTIALVAPGARLVWLCLPRIDSPALFAELLGGPAAGFFEISPAGDVGPAAQSYDRDSLILKTTWPTCTVTDYLDCAGGRAYQRAGRTDLVRVIEGSGRIRIRFAPRLDFGRVPTFMSVRDGVLEIEGAQDPIMLHAPGVNWTIVQDGPHHTAESEFELSHAPLVFELRYGTGSTRPHIHDETARRQTTHNFWSAWSASLRIPPLHPLVVRRSALMLRALCYGPTGAIAAAGTTSLPEHLGGSRNWDYRYCWPRDSALAAAALLRLGNTGTAMRLLEWLYGVLEHCDSPDRLHPIYTVSGHELGPEAEISGLNGYGESRPVRVGNAAAQQVQLDVFGPIADLVASLVESGAPVAPDHWRVTRAMVEAVEARWKEPDHGIWEIRGPKRHHVHSRVMCYHTVDRAMVVHEHMVGGSNPNWMRLREQIREDVLANGIHAESGAFTASYGSGNIDAASLLTGLVGLVSIDDPRFTRTVSAVENSLRRGPVVYRYLYEDGLPGREGGFHLCTSWLIEAMVKQGRVQEARELFDDFVARAGPTGILSEQYDPSSCTALGNVPQAYSHVAVINAAVALSQHGETSEESGNSPKTRRVEGIA